MSRQLAGPQVFEATRVRTLDDGSTEYYIAVFEYTGDPEAPFIAQGKYHTDVPLSAIREYDSTWTSTCIRYAYPEDDWHYYEHPHWWKVGSNRHIFLPSLPLLSVFIDDEKWRTATQDDEGVIFVTQIDDVVYYTFVLKSTGLIVREEVVSLTDNTEANTYYVYGEHERPVVHESEEDCLSRNDS